MVQILGRDVGVTGYGMMNMSLHPDTAVPIDKAVSLLRTAFLAGCTLWSGAEFYGTPEYNSMTVLKAYFTAYPDDARHVTIVIKGGGAPGSWEPDGSPENTRRSIQTIIDQLGGTKKLDIWNPGRRDPKWPLEASFKVAQEFIDQGLLGGVALSEVSPATIEEAVKIGKVELAELELSMFSPYILRNGVAATCAKYNIPIMGYSPVDRGTLAGRYKSIEDVKGILTHFPRFQKEAFEKNQRLAQKVHALADKKKCTAAQLAIAWVRAQGGRDGNPAIIPIPGSCNEERIRENAVVVSLTEEEFQETMELVNTAEVAGERYPDMFPTET